MLYAAAKPDCAPNDGPAWRFLLSSTPVTCADLSSASEGYFLWLWTGDVMVRTYSIGTLTNSEGSACLCGFVADNATSGSVTIHEASDAGIRGRLDATFSQGRVQHDEFEAILCPSTTMCR